MSPAESARLMDMAVRLQSAARLDEVAAEFFRTIAETDASITGVIDLQAAWGGRRVLRLAEKPPEKAGQHGVAWRVRTPGAEIDLLLWRVAAPFGAGEYWSELRRQVEPALVRACEHERTLEEASLLRAEWARRGAFILEERQDATLCKPSPETAAVLARHFPSEKALESFLQKIRARLDFLPRPEDGGPQILPDVETAAGMLRFRTRLLPNGLRRVHYVSEIALFQPAPWVEGLGLSKRRSEVLHWLLQGKSNPEIALILGITRDTVKEHVRWLLDRFCVRNRGDLLRKLVGSP